MPTARDIWYVRFPDGEVVRAKSTASVRRHLEKGRIPFDCRVRRSGQYEWITLEWAPEFADLLKRPAKSEKPEPKIEARPEEPAETPDDFELRTVGVRGLVDELIAALDSTLNRSKLTVAAVAGFWAAVLLVVLRLGPWHVDGPADLALSAAFALAILAGFIVCTVVITQITVLEVSQLRSPSFREATGHLFGNALRLLVCWLIVGGIVGGAIVGARELPEFVRGLGGELPARHTLLNVAAALSLVFEVMLWPVLGLALLIPPVIVVEEISPIRALLQWLSLVRENLGRILLYEALAVTVAGVTTIPFLVPILVAGWHAQLDISFAAVVHNTLLILYGLAATPFIAFLIVANVFVYLNLRYEFSPSAK